MAEITESIFDYLQEAASPLNLDGSGDDEDDDDDDLRNMSTSFYNHSQLDIAAINEEETEIVNATTTSSIRDEKVLHHQQQILNDSTELFYSAASAVSACLPFDNTSPGKQAAAAAWSSTNSTDRDRDPTDITGTGTVRNEINGSGGLQLHHSTGGLTSPDTPAFGTNYGPDYAAWSSPYPATTPSAATAISEAKSFVNGLLSPFSPILVKENLPAEDRTECMQFVSLQPCRKVSVVVRVLSVPEGDDHDADGRSIQRCVFPHYKDDEEDHGSAYVTNQTTNLKEGGDDDTFEYDASSKRVVIPRDMVVVNPTAFGKYIPSQVTMETAKLVAQVAHISSEDWARLYEFHHVMWPSTSTPLESKNNDVTNGSSTSKKVQSQYNTMDALSRAVSQDALVEHQSSLLISLGQEASCIGTDSDAEQLGLWTMILNQCHALVETKGMLRLSMVEVLEDKPDSFRDLLFHSHRHHHHHHHHQQQQQQQQQQDDPNNTDRQEASFEKPIITLRHPDMNGAVLEGLTEVPIDSMPALLESLARRRRRRNKAVSASTAVIGILKYWDSAVSFELNRQPCSQITCVELSNGHSNKAESIIHRKSTVSLGQALRQLLLRSSGTPKAKPAETNTNSGTTPLGAGANLPAVSFRETTLTKVLQRAMESSKICLVASISPLSKDYEQTITTLNYLRRLLVQPGKTVSSPFKPSKHHQDGEGVGNISFASTLSSKAATQADVSAFSSRRNDERLQELAQQKGVLESLVADPRQRLAKILKTSPARKPMPTMFESRSSYDKDDEEDFLSNGSSHNYRPTNYMNEVPASLDSRINFEQRGNQLSHDGGPPRTIAETRGDEMNPTPQLIRTSEEHRLKPQNDTQVDKGAEWASEEEVEQALQDEIEGVFHSLYPEEDFSDEDDVSSVDHVTDGPEFPIENGTEDLFLVVDDEGYNGKENLHSDFEDIVSKTQEDRSFEGHFPNSTSDTNFRERAHNERGLSSVSDRSLDLDDADNRAMEMALDEDGEDDATLGLTSLTSDIMIRDRAYDHQYLDGVEELEQDETYTPVEGWQQNYQANERSPPHLHEGAALLLDREENFVDSDDNVATHRSYVEVDHQAKMPEFRTNDDVETEYDLPQQPLSMNESLISDVSPQAIVEKVSSDVQLTSPERKRSAFSTFSPYKPSFTSSSRTKGNDVLSRERKHLNSTVEALQHNLRRASEEHSEHLQQYEEEVQDLRARLEEALDERLEIERLANEAINTQASYEEEVITFNAEREELRSTVESLRDSMENLSKTHDEQLQRYQQEIESAVEAQRVLEKIADDAVAAHEAQMEETRVISEERDALQSNFEMLQSNLNETLEENSTHIQRYHREIRDLHQKLETTMDEKRSVQMAADEARIALESQTEKVRALMAERDQLITSLSSFQGNAKKVSGEHSDHLRGFKEEIQQLHLKLDKALSEKLAAEKAADEIRFSNDDLERRLQIVEGELTSYRVTNTRLEKMRREDQDVIFKLTADVRKKESERFDVEHLKNELLRLKQSKDHLEKLMARRQSEYADTLRDRDAEIVEYKTKHTAQHEEIANLKAELTVERNQKEDAMDQIQSYEDKVSRITEELRSKEEGMDRVQTQCTRLEMLCQENQDTIRALNADLRKRDEEKVALDELKHKLLRLTEHRDHLETLIKTRKAEYEEFMSERTNEAAEYINEIQSLKKKLQATKDADHKHRSEAAARLQALQESESSMIQAVQQRDDIIERLKLQLSTTKEEVASILEREKSRSSNANHEMSSLRQRIQALEEDLSSARQALDESAAKHRNDYRDHKIVLGELERARDETKRQKTAIDRLHEEVAARQRESLRSQEKMFQMESSLRRFQEETKEKVGTMVCRQKESSSILEKTKQENQALVQDVRRLEQLVEKLKRQRDACYESLKNGRAKLAELSLNNCLNGPFDDLFETSSKEYKEFRHVTNEPVATKLKRSVLPELYITDYYLGDRVNPGLSLRAEEIAACVAISAKNSLQESHDETSQLRSHIYRLEEERTAEVSALKAKVRTLERELSHQQQSPLHRVDSSSNRHGVVSNNKRYASYPFIDPVG
ncbi:myosin heavy chain [Nitzschia inconspicua]|uniref:Myosin heavy chain n=1 Tax=Nitzschia inconspicua TaxID=303405 RepID=A0A9K3Q1G7_9STRA|nr:myosin heavy chain [Nitzschia inconspicua]